MDYGRLRDLAFDAVQFLEQAADTFQRDLDKYHGKVLEFLDDLEEKQQTQARQDDQDKGPVKEGTQVWKGSSGSRFVIPVHLRQERDLDEKIDFILDYGSLDTGSSTWNALKYDKTIREFTKRNAIEWIDSAYKEAYENEWKKYQDAEW